MSTIDPTVEGGRGGDPTTGGPTNTEENVIPTTPATGTSVPAGSQQQHPPPSPLSGCYLLVVLPEPHTAQHKDLILNRLAKGFLSWDKGSCHVDLEKELQALVAQAPEGEEARNGERLIQYATENLVTEVLIHPQTNTLLQCIRNLLASFTKHRHIIHAGYTFGGNGSWILQDGTFSLADFLDAFSEHEVQRVLRAYENSVTVDIHCASVGDWMTSRLSKESCTRSCRVRVNPDDVLTAGVPAITSFTTYVGQYLVAQTLDQLMEPSDVVGNIRFSHPTLYVFPGGQGDAALFGINGFNMLVDGGFARKACFWDFTRHLDRLDAVLVTRINNSNVGGMSSVLRKKKEMHVYPQIGHFFCNLVERRQSNSPDGDKDIDPLILNLTDIGQEMMANLRHINLRPHPCYRDPDPINLYHKVGHGTLDMYVLSPNKDSREVRDFMAKWHAADSKLFAGFHKKDPNILTFPIQNLASICALLVWQPANPEDTITRILFPGSTPQHKIFEGFERLKHLDFLKHPVCSAKSLSPSPSLVALRDKPAKQKLGLIEKEAKKDVRKEKKELPESKVSKPSEEVKAPPTPIIPTGKPQGIKAEMKAKKVVENKKIESETKESKKIEKDLKEVKKEHKKDVAKVEKPEKPDKPEKKEEETKKPEIIKTEAEKIDKPVKEVKSKAEIKKRDIKETKTPTKAPRVDLAPKPKPIEKKKPSTEKKDTIKSSPTTPKKTMNGAATKMEISKAPQKAKPVGKLSTAPPAKSTKDANNRKVVEQKNIEMSTIKDTGKETSGAGAKAPAKPKPIDRKPISRRTKPVSPSKARVPLSPAKSTRSTPTASVKSDKDGVVRKIKGERGTTDSSTVSTPSGIEHEAVPKMAETSLAEKSEDISLDSIESKVLADLKEEREVVEEIEAVLQKAERIEGARKEDHFEGDDEITAEATDKKDDDMTEEDVTAEIEDAPKKEGSRKESQELTEEDEYLIVEKEEVYTEDSVQSGEGEQKHVLDEAESEKAKILEDRESVKERDEKVEVEEKEGVTASEKEEQKEVEMTASRDEKEKVDKSPELKDQLDGEAKEVISSPEAVQKTEDKDDSGKKDSDDITKEPSSLSPDKFDSSEKKTTDTDMKPDIDLKDQAPEKLEESQERISTLESGATTTAPTLPEDERIPLDEIKEDIDEKYVMEEVKEKDVPKIKEEVPPRQMPVPAAKPEIKAFDVRQTPHGIQREIVKTPDEVADLPVHEEVDPKFYRMEDFEKDKEEKPVTPQEVKEPTVITVKEQKGVLGFFGKVADRFEKGIDKLTKKTRKDPGDKDAEDKSSSKSSSPKEPKPQEKVPAVSEMDMEKLFPKVGKPEERPADVFEKIEPTMAEVKVASIKETSAFIKQEIEDARKTSVPEVKVKITDKVEEIVAKDVTAEKTPSKDSAPLSPVNIDEKKEQVDDILKDEGEDAEEIKALLEEASKKFKTVKDSLRDSIESLEEIIEEELPERLRQPSLGKDIVKDTLEGVVERLEEMKPQIESVSPDLKETEKPIFDIPKDEEFEKDYESIPGPMRDVKEAVRDVGEVLAGTAGIEIDDKPKDVVEIVKKVAEVLKDDDFLSDKVLFEEPIQQKTAESTHAIPSVTEKEPKEDLKDILDEIRILKKVGVTEILPSEEEIEEAISYEKKPIPSEVIEEPCVKMVKEGEKVLPPQVNGKEKEEAMKICAEMLEEDRICMDRESKRIEKTSPRLDVMDSGEEIECIKEVCKDHPKDKQIEKEVEEPKITFEKKGVPAKAELVVVTPGSTPTSPKFAVDKICDIQLQETIKSSKLPAYTKDVLNKDASTEEIVEELIVKKTKITVEIIEYITIVKRISREQVIYIIQEIIVKRGIPKESVVDDEEILNLGETITQEKRMKIEEYIFNEYISQGKRITIEVIEEISIMQMVSRRIVIEIVEEIIVKKKLVRNMIVDYSAEELSELDEAAVTAVAKEEITAKADITDEKRKSIADIHSPSKEKIPSPTEKETETVPQEGTAAKSDEKIKDDGEEEKMVDGFVSIPSGATFIQHDEKHEKIEDTTIFPLKSEKDFPLASQEHKKDLIDDFEAVEQEYKVKGVRVTSPEGVSCEAQREDDLKDMAEEVEDDESDVIEADEKFVKETKEKVEKIEEPQILPVKEEKLVEAQEEKVIEKVEDKREEKKEHEDITTEDISEVSEIIDAKEKYLDEAKEKAEDVKAAVQVGKEPVNEIVDKRKESLRDAVSPVEVAVSLNEMKEPPSRKESTAEVPIEEKPKLDTDKFEKDEEKSQELQDEIEEETVISKTPPETKLADATGRAAEPKLDVTDEDKQKSESKIVDADELKEQQRRKSSTEDVKIIEGKLKTQEEKAVKGVELAKELTMPEVSMKIDEKLTTEEQSEKEKDLQVSEKPPDLSKEDTPETATVQKMLVTASSEDGGQETVICPTGTITFSKTVTPDDSLKDTSIKSTPDKDSLHMDKDSLRSGMSTPEKDSISEKSSAEAKDGGKITPEDSLEKSPLGKTESPDLEDSLEKTDAKKPQEIDSGSLSFETDVPQTVVDENLEKVEISEKSAQILTKETEKVVEKIDTPDIKSAEQSQLPVDKKVDEVPYASAIDEKVTEEPIKKPVSPVQKDVAKEVTEELKSLDEKKPKEESVEDAKSAVDKTVTEGVAEAPKSSVEIKPSEAVAEKPKSPISEKVTHEVSEKETEESTGKPVSPEQKEVAKELTEELKSPDGKKPKEEAVVVAKFAVDKTVTEGAAEAPKSPVEQRPTEAVAEKPKSPISEKVTHEVSEKETVQSTEKPVSPEQKDVAQELRSPDGMKPKEEPVEVAKSAVDKTVTERAAEAPKSSVEQKPTEAIAEKPKSPISEKATREVSEKTETAEQGEISHALTEKVDVIQKPKSPVDKTMPDEKPKLPAEQVKEIEERDVIPKSPTLEKPKEKIPETAKSETDIKLLADVAEKQKSPEEQKITQTEAKTVADKEIAEKSITQPAGEQIAVEVPDKAESSVTHAVSRELLMDKQVTEEISVKPKPAEIPSEEEPQGPETIPSEDISSVETIFEKSPTDKQDLSLPQISSDQKNEETLIEKTLIEGVKLLEKEKTPSPVPRYSPTEKTEIKEGLSSTKETKLPEPLDKEKTPSSVSEPAVEVSGSKSRSSSIVDEKAHDAVLATMKDKLKEDEQDTKDLKSPIVTDEEFSRKKIPEKVDGDQTAEKPIDKSRSASIASEKQDDELIKRPEGKDLTGSRTPSVSEDKIDHVVESISKSRAASIISTSEEQKKLSELEDVPSKSRSPSIVSEDHIQKEPISDKKSPIVVDGKFDKKTEQVDLEKPKSLDILSDHIQEEFKQVDKSKSPSLPADKAEIKETDAEKSPVIIEKQELSKKVESTQVKSPSVVSETPTSITQESEQQKSRSASIVSEHTEENGADGEKSPSAISDKVEEKKAVDAPKLSSPTSISPDMKDTKQLSPELKSPSITEITEGKRKSSSISDTEGKEMEIQAMTAVSSAKSPVVEDEKIISQKPSDIIDKVDIKEDTEVVTDKSRLSSIVSVLDEQKTPEFKSLITDKADEKGTDDHSKLFSITDEKSDLKEVTDLADKSRLVSVVSAVDQKDSVDGSKSPSIASEKPDLKEVTDLADKSRLASVVSAVDQKDSVDRSKSPSIAGEKPDLKEVTDLAEKSRSASIASAADQKDSVDQSKSPSIAGEKPDLKEVAESVEKSRSASIASAADQKDSVDQSKSPSIAGEKPDLKEVTDLAEKSRSASIASAADQKDSMDQSKSPSIAGEKPDLKEVTDLAEKSRSTSIISTVDQKDSPDKSKSPSIAGEKPDLKDVTESADKSRSASIVSGVDQKGSPDQSKSPSITGEKPDLKEVTDLADKSRSASIVSAVDQKDSADHSKSPSIAGEKPDLKDVLEVTDKSGSPSISSAADQKDSVDQSKSPSIASEKPDLKDVTESVDKSRSASIVSPVDQKGSPDQSKSPSITGEKPDLKEVTDLADKSRSASIVSAVDQKDSADHSKSPSIAGEKPDLKDVLEVTDKSGSPSISSAADQKDSVDQSKSPSIASEKPDLKDVTESADKSRSASIVSTVDQKDSPDKSKSPSIAGEKPDLKDLLEATYKSRSASIASVADQKDSVDQSKSPSIASEKPDLKDVTESVDKSRSASIASAADQKDSVDQSKSPSIAGEKPDLKDVTESADKSRSASIVSAVDQKDSADRSKSPSIAGEKPDLKDLLEATGKSRSASIASAADQKDSVDQSKSPSIAGEKPDLKDITESVDKSRSASIASAADQKDSMDQSKSPSIAGEKPDLKEVAESVDKSRSASIVSAVDQKDSDDQSKSPSIAGEKPDLKDVTESADKSRSASIVSAVDQKDSADQSKSPSIAAEQPDLKDVTESVVKSRSASIASAADQKDSVDQSKSPSIAGEKPDLKDVTESADKSRSASIVSAVDQKDSADRSKSPSIAGEKPDLKDLLEATDKSRSASIASAADQKDSVDQSKSPSIAIEKPDLKNVIESVDKSRSASIVSAVDQKDSADQSKSPSIAAEQPDLKDVTESVVKSRSASIASAADQKDSVDQSKSPSIAGEKPDLKDVTESADKCRSASIVSAEDQKDSADRSKSPSIAGEKPDLKDVTESVDKSRSASIVSAVDQKDSADQSKSPSIAAEQPDLKDVTESVVKSRSASIASAADQKDSVDQSKSPSIAGEKPDLKEVTDLAERSRSASIASAVDQKDSVDQSKSPSIAGEKPDLKDITESVDKSRSASIASAADQKDSVDQSKSPSIADEQPDLKEVTDLADKSRSASIVSAVDQKDSADRSKSPSIAGEKPDLKDLLEATGKSRSASIASAVDQKDSADRSKSPSIAGEKPDLKDLLEATGKSRSASIASAADQKDSVDQSKSPSIAGEKPDLKDITESVDKSRSASIASAADQKDSMDQSKSPSIAGEKPDLKEVAESVDKSRSASIVSAVDQKDSVDQSKSPSIAGEKPDLKDITESVDKSRSASIASTADQKDSMDQSKSPSIAGEKPDLKEVAESVDKSRSASIVSAVDQKDSVDQSKSPSIAGEKPDLKDITESVDKSRSASIASAADQKDSMDQSKSPSIAGEKPDLKEVAESVDKSRSASIVSAVDQKDSADQSKSPSIADEKPDLKDVTESVVKSRSASISAIDQTGLTDQSKSPSVAEGKLDLKELLEPNDKSRPGSIIADHKSPSILSEKDELIPTDKAKSPSVKSDKSDEKEGLDDSRKSSVSEAKVDLKESLKDFTGKSKSPSPSDDKLSGKETYEDAIDKSRSPSVASEKLLDKEPTPERKFSDQPLTAVDKKAASPTNDVSKEIGSDKFRAASISSEKPDDSKDDPSKTIPTGTLSSEVATDEKLSKGSSPTERITLADGSESHSFFKTGEKTPLDSSSSTDFHEDKASKKGSPTEEFKATLKLLDTTSTFQEKDDSGTSPKKEGSRKSSTAEIEKDKVDSRRSSHVTDSVEKPDSRRSSHAKGSYISHTVDGLEETEEDFTSVEKKAEIEKYIIDEYVTKKKKITVIIVEELIMTYSVPKFVVMDVIEDVIQKKQISRESIMDFVDDTASDTEESKDEEMKVESLTPDKKADIEKYIMDEFVKKNKKISSKILHEMTILKAVPRYILFMVIEEIIITKKISRMSLIETDLKAEIDHDMISVQKDEKVLPSGALESEKIVSKSDETIVTREGSKKYDEDAQLSSMLHDKSSEDRLSPPAQEQLERDSQADSKSLASSRESIASDKSTQNSPTRSEPHIDEEVSISEEKRREVEKLLEEEYVKKSRKITDVVLEEIIMRTGLPVYIILEIVEEIILVKKLVREDVISVDYAQVDEESDDLVMMERYESKYPDDSSRHTQLGDFEQSSDKLSEYSEADDRHLGKSISGYSMDYESPFHKAFVGGMTEMRTTHITTLSAKSTPDFTPRDGTPDSASEPTVSTIERAQVTLDKISPVTGIRDTSTVITQVLRDTKISEPAPEEPVTLDKVEKTDLTEKEEPQIVRKIVKREIIEEDEPEVIKKVIKREVIEQEDPNVVTKVIKHEIVVPEDSTDIAKDIIKRIVSGEESVETKVTKIVTEGMSDPKTSTSGSVKPEIYSYTLPSNSAAEKAEAIKKEFRTTTESSPVHVTKIISREGTPEVSVSADVKRIITTVTTITEPDGTVTTKKDVKESTDTMDSEELEKLIDSVQSETGGKVTTEASTAEKIVKETISKIRSSSGTSTPDVKTFYDSGKSTPDWKHEEKSETISRDIPDKMTEHGVSPLVRDLISDDKSYSGKSSPDISLPKDIIYSGSTGKSTPEVPVSPLIRDSAAPHLSGRSTPDRKSDRSATATPEGFRSGEVIRTIITTTRTMSEEGEIITTTKEVTEATNEKGETVILAEKTDVKFDDWPPSKDTAETAISSVMGTMKPSEVRGESVAGSDVASEMDIAVSSPPSSPLSVDSHKEEAHRPVEFATAAMTSSFYGEMLPEMSPLSSSPSVAEKEYAGEYDEKRSTKKFMNEDEMNFLKGMGDRGEMRDILGDYSSDDTSRYTVGRLTTRDGLSDSSQDDRPTSSSTDGKESDSKKDPLKDWGPPLGLPSPKPPKKFNLKNPIKSSSSTDLTPDSLTFDVVSDWGEPLRLPSPAPVANEVSNKGTPATPKKEKKQAKKVQSENMKNKKRSESPGKNEKKAKDSKNKIQPIYMDLTYVPHHGNSYYTSLEFFKRVRARYYVFSGTEPSREVYDALLDAKKTWEDKDLEVTMIPTYDTDTLGYWVADNEEVLAANHIDLSPSASRCTINLQDHETSCSAYRLEF